MVIFSMLSIVLIGIGHFYLHLLLIDYKRVKLSAVMVISLAFILLLSMIVSVYQINELNSIVLLLFLLFVGRYFKNLNWHHNLLLAMLNSAVFTFMKIATLQLVNYIFMYTPAPIYIWSISFMQLISLLLVILLIVLARKFIVEIGRNILQGRWYIPIYLGAVASFVLMVLVSVPSHPVLNAIYREHYLLFLQSFLVLMLFIVFILIVMTFRSKDRAFEREEQLAQEKLLEYVRKLEFMHDELVTFRHDYLNLLLSLNQSIQAGNIDQIKQSYQRVLEPTGYMLQQLQVELAKLANIKVDELKSLMSTKLMHAERQQIEIIIDIPYPIDKLPIPLASYLRTVSIFIDNAIESSKDVAHGAGVEVKHQACIQLAIFESETLHHIIVKNRIVEDSLDLEQLYTKHYSTKGEQRGIGLFSVQRLINSYSNTTLLTEVEADWFTQMVTIKK